MKRGTGAVQEKIVATLKKAGRKGITTELLAERVGANRQYVRKVLRTDLAGSVIREGVASPKNAPVYIWKK